MWRHNEAAGEERGVRECVVRMWRQDASAEMECGVRECVVRMRRPVGMGMWRQGMQRQNAASGGNVASGENVASGNVSSECVRGECSVRENVRHPSATQCAGTLIFITLLYYFICHDFIAVKIL